ncbi:Tim44 domain-containing protein [Desulfomicrobium orale]|uniref:Tim44-like domain-containing protein n=1 Tax=Desulfomicrobium orale DSM 12838 TaxID=888061 RepID=A0A0X8JPE0_9BACT|nr:Tim44-like domain-containing protein [Desulfomicrobium orale]AMD92534.1 hypothetical protein AXF15_05030 [Desulfomicrobium orale DSM 12838]
MKKILFLMALALSLSLTVLTLPDSAEAKRLGGGRSFGSKPAYSQKYQKSSPQQPNQQGAPQAAPTGGRGPFGGLLGGLLAGGLLGSLLFGGAFSGIGLLDILLIGGGLFLLFRFLRSRQTALETPGGFQPSRERQSSWDALRSAPGSSAPRHASAVPAGFDTEEFLRGAKTAYTRMQDAWDRRDLEDLRQFTSPEVLAEIQTQAEEDPAPGNTEILLLEAQLLEVKCVGNQTVATVFFDAMLREDSPAAPAQQVREVWHFSRYETGGNSHWVVEGIQQMA